MFGRDIPQSCSLGATESFLNNSGDLSRVSGRMKYLFMVIEDEKQPQALSETEAQTLDDESLEYDDALRKGGTS
jgi:hypothetical protein